MKPLECQAAYSRLPPLAEARRKKRRAELAQQLATAETVEDRARARRAIDRYDEGTMSLVRKYDPETVRLRRQLDTSQERR